MRSAPGGIVTLRGRSDGDDASVVARAMVRVVDRRAVGAVEDARAGEGADGWPAADALRATRRRLRRRRQSTPR